MCALSALVINEPATTVAEPFPSVPDFPFLVRYGRARFMAATAAAANGACALVLFSLPYFDSITAELSKWARLPLGLAALGLSTYALLPLLAAFRTEQGGRSAKVEVFAIGMMQAAVVADLIASAQGAPFSVLPALALLLVPLPLIVARMAVRNLAERIMAMEESHLKPRTSSERLSPGAMVELSTGDEIPCDGIIARGIARIAESRFAGLSEVRIKGKSHPVFAGSRILDGAIALTVINPSEDAANTTFLRQYAASIRSVETGERRLTWLSWGLLAFGVSMALWWQSQGVPLADALLGAASFALISALVQLLLVPSLLRRGLVSGLFRRGVLFAPGGILQQLAATIRVAFWCPTTEQQLAYSAHSFTLEDERLERTKVLGLIAALVGHADEPLHRALARHSLALEPKPELFELQEYAWFPRYPGIAGSIGGVELSFGSEEFLIARGVHVTPQEVGNLGASMPLYLALGAEIVARCIVERTPFERGKECVTFLREQGLRPIMFSPRSGPALDEEGRSIGFELANIRGGVSVADLAAKADEIAPALLVMPAGIERSVRAPIKGVVRVARFDEVVCELPGAEVTLFTEDTTVVPAMLRASYLSERMAALAPMIVLGAGGVLCGAALLQLVNPASIAFVCAVAVTSCALLAQGYLARIGRLGVASVRSH